MDYAIPASKIATLSSGEFVGIVSDNPDQKIKLKMFHCEIQNDHNAIAEEERNYKPIPPVENVTHEDVIENYFRIKKDIERLFEIELEKIVASEPKAEEPEESLPDEGQDDEEVERGISR